MTSTAQRTTLHLAADDVLRLVPRAPVEVRVLRGRLWITEEGCVEDRVLEAAGQARLGGGGVALLQAMGPAELCLQPVGAAGDIRTAFAARVRRVVRRLDTWGQRMLLQRDQTVHVAP